MKKVFVGFIGILITIVLTAAGCQESLVGESCGTVSPDSRDECCERQNKDTPHIQCVGSWKYNEEKAQCEFKCETSGIANPASVKCEEDGGELKIINNPEGEQGVCFFPDGSVCDEWAYYRGECKQGDCMKNCGAIGSRSEGWYDCDNKLLYWDNCG